MSQENPLASRALILHLEISKWAGEVSDQRVLNAVAKTYKSDTHNDKYRKSLFIGKPMHEIELLAGRLRNHFYRYTTPWLDGGKGRLIPSVDFQKYSEEFSQMKMQFYQAVDTFIADYDDLKDQAKEHKGDLYNEAEYPSKDILRKRFSINLLSLPFPDVKDLRIDAPQEVIDELKVSMKESLERVQDVVTTELYQRFMNRIYMLKKTLTVGKRFNKSLLTELELVLDMAEKLDTVVDPKIHKQMETARTHILVHTPERIRNSQSLQDALIEICDQILK